MVDTIHIAFVPWLITQILYIIFILISCKNDGIGTLDANQNFGVLSFLLFVFLYASLLDASKSENQQHKSIIVIKPNALTLNSDTCRSDTICFEFNRNMNQNVTIY